MVGLRIYLVNALGRTRRVFQRGARGPFWALAMLALSVGLTFVPLFDLLGYDFSFAIGLVTAFAAADIGQGVVAAARRDRDQGDTRASWSLSALVSRAAVASLLLLVLPLVVICLNAFRVRNCNFAVGFAFLGLLPVSSALVAAPVGVAVGLAFPRWGRPLAMTLPFASMAWAALRLYVSPPVYALDPFGGFFPGPLYDEALTPPALLWQFRLANLVWVLALLAATFPFFRPEGPRGPRLVLSWAQLASGLRAARPAWRVLAASLVVVALATFLARGRLGFSRSHADLERALPRTHATPHFVVHRDPLDGQQPAELALFLDELEFRYAQLRHLLASEPEGPVTVFLFPSAEAKKHLVGAGATLFTKPWRREIYLQVEDFPPSHLRHELAHIFAARFGDPVFGISLRWWPWPRLASGLVEGLAEAADYTDPSGQATLHQDARSLVEARRAPPIDALVGAGFSVVAGPRAYTLAASFCRYLLDTFGAEKLKRLYASAGDFQTVYSLSLPELEQRWLAFLREQVTTLAQRAAAEERYRRPAIFEKVCARELAARVERASHLRSYAPEEAMALMRSVCSDDPYEPTFVLSFAYAQAAADQSQAALATLSALQARDDLTRPLRRRALSFRASLLVATNQFDKAREAETQALALATEEGDRRTSLARLRALSEPAARQTLGRVLFGDSPSTSLDGALALYLLQAFANAFPDDPLGPYLLGRQLVNRDPRIAFSLFSQACPQDAGETETLAFGLEPVFLRACFRQKGESAYRAGRHGEAQAAWQRAAALAVTEADRLRAEDYLERIAWAAARASKDR